MQTYLFSTLYLLVLAVLLWQAFRVMLKGFSAFSVFSRERDKSFEDRTGRLTIHPELLNKEGRITDEDLLTVRFSNDLDLDSSNSSERTNE